MSEGLLQITPHVPAFMLVFFRMTGIFIFAPMFGSSVLPMRAKVLLALVLAFCVYPIVPPQVPVTLSLGTIAFAVGSEILIGLIIGYGASLPLVAMQIGGQTMGHQLGLGLAQVFNPEFDEQTEVLSQFLFISSLAVFLLLDGHHAMLGALVHSYQSVPLGGYVPDGSLIMLITGMLGSAYELGLRVAAPLLCIIFLETIAMGFIARTVPQLNILSLGFPLRIIVGMFLLVGLAATMFTAFGDHMREMMGALMQMFTVGQR
jgi:flagellar biosynthetic protein FliR